MKIQKSTSLFSPLLKFQIGFKTLLTLLGVAAAGVLSAHAQLIDIAQTENDPPDTTPSTGSYMTGAAKVGTSGDAWNTLNFRDVHSFTNLENVSGHGSGVDLTVTGFQGENLSGSDSVGGLAPNLFENFAYEFNGGEDTMDFTHLADNTTYSLYIYNLNDAQHSDVEYTINGVTETLLQVGYSTYTSTATTNAEDPGAVYQGNYIKLIGTTSSTGELKITLDIAPTNTSNESNTATSPASNSFIAFNGLQIEVAPEPNTFALVAVGFFGLAFLARSRRSRLAFRA